MPSQPIVDRVPTCRISVFHKSTGSGGGGGNSTGSSWQCKTLEWAINTAKTRGKLHELDQYKLEAKASIKTSSDSKIIRYSFPRSRFDEAVDEKNDEKTDLIVKLLTDKAQIKLATASAGNINTILKDSKHSQSIRNSFVQVYDIVPLGHPNKGVAFFLEAMDGDGGDFMTLCYEITSAGHQILQYPAFMTHLMNGMRSLLTGISALAMLEYRFNDIKPANIGYKHNIATNAYEFVWLDLDCVTKDTDGAKNGCLSPNYIDLYSNDVGKSITREQPKNKNEAAEFQDESFAQDLFKVGLCILNMGLNKDVIVDTALASFKGNTVNNLDIQILAQITNKKHIATYRKQLEANIEEFEHINTKVHSDFVKRLLHSDASKRWTATTPKALATLSS
jgi:hypothetical protein